MKFGTGEIKVGNFEPNEEGRRFVYLIHTGEDHSIGCVDDSEEWSPDDFTKLAEHTEDMLLEFTNIKSLDVLIDTLNELKSDMARK